MVSKTKLTCHNCGNDFDKPLNEYNRQRRQGRSYFFCCRSCCTSWNHKQGKYSYEGWFTLRAQRRDKVKGRTGNVTVEYLKGLFEQQQGQCPFTGWKLSLPDNTNGWKDGHKMSNASLDRIDNSKGYLKGNVRFVSMMANLARSTFSDNELIRFCKSVAVYQHPQL